MAAIEAEAKTANMFLKTRTEERQLNNSANARAGWERDFVPRKHLSKSDQEGSQMSAYDRHVDLASRSVKLLGGRLPISLCWRYAVFD